MFNGIASFHSSFQTLPQGTPRRKLESGDTDISHSDISSPGLVLLWRGVRMRTVKRAAQQSGKQPAAWQAAAAYGCDMALLEEYLAMTPEQRVQAHRSALALAEQLRAAMEKSVERSGNIVKAAA
jgi:hypothetical protein